MDVRDRSTYPPNMETTGVQESARLQKQGIASVMESGSSALGGDSSQISATARTMAQTMQLPDVREDRIASLQQRIASGNYQVHSSDVADAILRSVAG